MLTTSHDTGAPARSTRLPSAPTIRSGGILAPLPTVAA
jgi:hypothetical protein